MSSEAPIIFNDAMVRAILEGRKTQTRRPAPIDKLDIRDCPEYASDKHGPFTSVFVKFSKPTKGSISTTTATHCTPAELNSWVAGKYGPWQIGDLLWVREAWGRVPVTAYRMSEGVQQVQDPNDADMAAVYRAGWERSRSFNWQPSIHMPRWASRITLRVKRVWVERVQSISIEDARAEGMPGGSIGEEAAKALAIYQGESWTSQQLEFAHLWGSIYGTWEENPFVWACEFEVVK